MENEHLAGEYFGFWMIATSDIQFGLLHIKK